MSNSYDYKMFQLNKYFFSFYNIQKAVEDYRSIVKITVYEHRDYFICEFEDSICSVEIVKKEFENYLIGLERCEYGY